MIADLAALLMIGEGVGSPAEGDALAEGEVDGVAEAVGEAGVLVVVAVVGSEEALVPSSSLPRPAAIAMTA